MSPTTPFNRAPKRPDFDAMARNWKSRRGSISASARRTLREQRSSRRRSLVLGSALAGGALLFGAGAAWATTAPTPAVEQATAVTLDVSAVIPPVAAANTEVETQTSTEKIVIEHETVKKDDSSVLEGTEKVVTEGQDGVTMKTSTVTLVDGEEAAREDSLAVEVSAPVSEVVAVGTKKRVVVPAVPSAPSNSGSNRAIGRDLAATRGWTGDEWTCLNALWTRESGWRHTADNPNSSAYGIPQALPGSKMSSAGGDWASNPATQVKWGLGYISNRYGSPCKAWSHSERIGWY